MRLQEVIPEEQLIGNIINFTVPVPEDKANFKLLTGGNFKLLSGGDFLLLQEVDLLANFKLLSGGNFKLLNDEDFLLLQGG